MVKKNYLTLDESNVENPKLLDMWETFNCGYWILGFGRKEEKKIFVLVVPKINCYYFSIIFRTLKTEYVSYLPSRRNFLKRIFIIGGGGIFVGSYSKIFPEFAI